MIRSSSVDSTTAARRPTYTSNMREQGVQVHFEIRQGDATSYFRVKVHMRPAQTVVQCIEAAVNEFRRMQCRHTADLIEQTARTASTTSFTVGDDAGQDQQASPMTRLNESPTTTHVYIRFRMPYVSAGFTFM